MESLFNQLRALAAGGDENRRLAILEGVDKLQIELQTPFESQNKFRLQVSKYWLASADRSQYCPSLLIVAHHSIIDSTWRNSYAFASAGSWVSFSIFQVPVAH
jgi:hypothetical protein